MANYNLTQTGAQVQSILNDVANKAPSKSPAFTGTPTAPTPTAGDNDTSIATTAFVFNEVYNNLVKNIVLNGAFDFWFRATTYTNGSGGIYAADRWRLVNYQDGTANWSRQEITPMDLIDTDIRYSLRVAVSGQTLSTARTLIYQNMEDARTFAGKTITISFYAKAASGTPEIGINCARNFGSGGSVDDSVLISKVSINTTWTKYSFTTTVPSILGKTIGDNSIFQLSIYFSAGSSYSASAGGIAIQSNTFDVTGIMIAQTPVVVPFIRAGRSLGGEFSECLRHFQRIGGGATDAFGTGFWQATTAFYCPINFYPKRLNGNNISFSFGAVSQYRVLYANAAVGVSALQANVGGGNDRMLLVATTSAITAGTAGILQRTDTATDSRIDVSADL